MDNSNEKLTKKEYLELIVEGGIGAIPYIGGVVQSLYFGSKNEKRFKRIEKFYKNLNESLENIRDQIPEDVFNLENKDQLIGIFEGINDEVEKSKAQIEPLMTKVTRFLGIEHTCKRISLLTAVSLIYQAIPVVPTVFDDWI